MAFTKIKLCIIPAYDSPCIVKTIFEKGLHWLEFVPETFLKCTVYNISTKVTLFECYGFITSKICKFGCYKFVK